jgi:hypothetical protein
MATDADRERQLDERTEELLLHIISVFQDQRRQWPDCICRDLRCDHPASKHLGPEGMCVVEGCRCKGWM